ncbi:MAG: 23S rRNA (uracil(1939)-C(5))-methyltransferase RlmD [Eubacteriales bacterium]|nr:23S rRNA (uracil(1939)-C(5))-methyltransferase RlmD [Eubacteriales bacterium]
MITKNELLTLSCVGLGSDLEGVCDHEGMAVFVPGALPGETVEAQIVKVFPRYAFAKLKQINTPSPQRVAPPCPVYEQCGGCSGQHMDYAATLEAKRSQVLELLTRVAGLSLSPEDVPPVLGAAEPWHCRNKTALPVGGTSSVPQLGFYRRRSHAIVPITDCMIAMNGIETVIRTVRGWMRDARVQPYQEETGKGVLRHVVVRTNRQGDVMVLLVSTKLQLPDTDGLVSRLQAKVPGFKALHLSVNQQRNNVILGNTSQKLWGEDAIYETLLGLTFEISPLSFFQVNPAQTERLYQRAIDFAALTPGDTVVDAYAGAGTIALCMAGQASRVLGIEIVPQAVESAKRNAERNGVSNAEFHVGAVEELLPRLVEDGLRPDVIVLDPPRKGVEPAVIEAVLKAKPRRVVYISCHVPTQARDMKLLCQGGYRFEACQPVDMFCYAGGVENVACLVQEEKE